MTRATSDLPFGSEFSPSQIELPTLLDLAHKHGGDPHALEAAILARYFTEHAASAEGDAADYNRGKLANNCKLGMIAYGVIDRAANLTEFGQHLYGLRNDEPKLYDELARHILLHLNGLNLVQCVQDMQVSGETVTLNKLREWLAGSCVTGEVAERLNRRWVCVELIEDYLKGAVGRFQRDTAVNGRHGIDPDHDSNYYRVPRPGILWNGAAGDPLPGDGGKTRPSSVRTARKRIKADMGGESTQADGVSVSAAAKGQT